MRVALITPGFSASEQDWCIPALLNLVRELARRHEVHVFTLRYPHRRDTYRVYGSTVHPFGGALVDGAGRLSLLARALANIVRHGSRRRFDVLHGLWADEPGFLAVVAGRLLRVPAVVALLGGELVGLGDIGYGTQLSATGRQLVRAALAGASCVTVGSTYLQRLTDRRVHAARLRLMPLGVDTALFHPGERAEDDLRLEGEIRLLHAASLVPVKDQTTLLRALASVVPLERGVHLHVVGDGPLRHRLEELAASLDISRHLTFHGAVSHDQLPPFYRAADLCVLTSRHESQGMVTLEAAACQRPTVGTAVGLLPDFVPAEDTGPVGDVEALASVILRACRDPERLRATGAAARRRVAGGYALGDTVSAVEALYQTLTRS